MKVYLAAPYASMELMREWANLLEKHGHICTARWLLGKEEGMTTAEAARMDLDDVDMADAVVSLTLKKGTMFSSGGRHVEFGYGLAKGKLMIIVNAVDRENIFHHLKSVFFVSEIREAIKLLS